jgi:NTP pyrophosphatase (non-canonical NTP hydrolase)
MQFKEFVQKADLVTDLYKDLNKEQGFPQWLLQDYVQGFTEDVGTLSRLTMMKAGVRKPVDNLDEKLKHEVCDCLWSVIRVAQALNIDLETEFPRQMDKLAKRIREEKH